MVYNTTAAIAKNKRNGKRILNANKIQFYCKHYKLQYNLKDYIIIQMLQFEILVFVTQHIVIYLISFVKYYYININVFMYNIVTL